MADSLMTTGTETAAITPEIWSEDFYDALLANLPFNSVISRRYEGEVSKLGDTVKIPSFPEFGAAVVVSEGARNDAAAVTATSQSLVINQMVAQDFILTDEAQLQSLPAMDKLKDLAIYSIMKKIQALIIADITPNAAAPDHAIGYTSATTLALADILAVKRLLDAQNTPMGGRHAVLDTNQANDVFNISGFVSSDFTAGANLLTTGVVGNPLLGFQPHVTTEVSDVCHFFHDSFYIMAAQSGITVKAFDMGVDGYRAGRVNCHSLIGIKQLDGLRVVTLT